LIVAKVLLTDSGLAFEPTPARGQVIEGQSFERPHKFRPICSVPQTGVRQNQGIADRNGHTALSIEGRAQMVDPFQIDGQTGIIRAVAEEMRRRHDSRNPEIDSHPCDMAEQIDIRGRLEIPGFQRLVFFGRGPRRTPCYSAEASDLAQFSGLGIKNYIGPGVPERTDKLFPGFRPRSVNDDMPCREAPHRVQLFILAMGHLSRANDMAYGRMEVRSQRYDGNGHEWLLAVLSD